MEETDGLKKLREKAHSNGSQLIEMCNQIEFEISELKNESRQELIDLVGLEEPGLNKLIKTAFRTLGLQTFFTSGQSESRAWVIKNGTKAPDAAGVIHTDFKKGFIPAYHTPHKPSNLQTRVKHKSAFFPRRRFKTGGY